MTAPHSYLAERMTKAAQAALIDCHHGSNCRDTVRDAHCWPADQTARAVLAAVLPLLADEIDASPDEKHPRWVARRNLATDLRGLAEQVSA